MIDVSYLNSLKRLILPPLNIVENMRMVRLENLIQLLKANPNVEIVFAEQDDEDLDDDDGMEISDD